MNLKISVKQLKASCLQAIKVYLQTFYHPGLYRDVAYRETGYGFSRILWTLAGLMFISYGIIASKLIYHYDTELKSRLLTLPNLVITNGKLDIYHQSLASTALINPKYFIWNTSLQTQDIFSLNDHKKIILSSDYLWVPYQGSKYFGYGFSSLGNYLPLTPWSYFRDFVNGKILVDKINRMTILIMLLFLSLPIFLMNCFFVFCFIRTFAYVAKNMVVIALKESIEYHLCSRLLCLAGIPTMTMMAILINVWGLNEQTKYYFMVIYMFYYYLSLRFIRAKSYFRWMKV